MSSSDALAALCESRLQFGDIDKAARVGVKRGEERLHRGLGWHGEKQRCKKVEGDESADAPT